MIISSKAVGVDGRERQLRTVNTNGQAEASNKGIIVDGH
jgi:hypothetical protein